MLNIKTPFLAGLLIALTAGCDMLNTDLERGVVGAGAGAGVGQVVAGAPVTGAIIGGVAGVLCDDAGICR